MPLYLWDHVEAITAQLGRASHWLCCTDYDGTLTELVNRPDAAELSPRVRERLRVLSARSHCTVAIVSGRSLADVRQRVGLPDLIYAGNHGMEIAGPGWSFTEPTALASRDALDALCRDLIDRLGGLPGVQVENKGLTASVHYRRASPVDQEHAIAIVEEIVGQQSTRFRHLHGHRIVEVRPRVDWHKGSAVSWLMGRLDTPRPVVLYLGDDRTDEDVFSQLPDILSVRIGLPKQTAARWFLHTPVEVDAFLSLLGNLPWPAVETDY